MFALILIGCAKCDESANTCDTLPRNAEFGSIFINGIVESVIYHETLWTKWNILYMLVLSKMIKLL